METVLAALITGAVTLIGVLIANSRSQAVTDTKLEELTREVRAHNNFAQRVPVLEEQMISTGFTVGAALAAWWKNNSFTPEAIEADAFMARMKKRVR